MLLRGGRREAEPFSDDPFSDEEMCDGVPGLPLTSGDSTFISAMITTVLVGSWWSWTGQTRTVSSRGEIERSASRRSEIENVTEKSGKDEEKGKGECGHDADTRE